MIKVYMKVLILNQIPEVNNKYTFSLARALCKKEIDVVVCGIENDNVSAYSDVPFLNLFGNFSQKSKPISKIFSYRKSLKKVLRYCVENSIDIVHVQWYIFSPFDYLFHKALRKRGIKVVTTIHDLLPFNQKFYDFHYHKKIYSNSDMVITQTQGNREPLENKFQVKSNKIIYIPHGHYMEYAETASKMDSRHYLSIDDDKQVILFFGQIKKVKGVDVLIKAMRFVADKNPNVLCVIAGKVWKDDFSVYQNLIDELGLNDFIKADIKFIADDEIKYYFNAADIVALPYRQIYQSGVVLLACAYEKPIVATTEGEFLNVIKDGETGLLVPSDDEKSFADAINWYLANPDAASKYAQACKEDLSVRLSWDTIADSIILEYNKVLLN